MSAAIFCALPVLPSRQPCRRLKGHDGSCDPGDASAVRAALKAGTAVHESMLRHPAGTQASERPNVDEAIIARLRRIRAAIPEMTRPLALHVEEVDALLAAVDERDALRRELTDMPDEAKARRERAMQALREVFKPLPGSSEDHSNDTGQPSDGSWGYGFPTFGETIATPRVVRCECREDYMCWAHGCGALQPDETETTR